MFYNFRMAVRVKMCVIDTVNGTFGKELGFENELIGSELNSPYIKFAFSSWVQHRIREADHSPPSRAEDKNGWK